MRERKYTVRFTEDEAEWLQEVALDGNVSGYIRDAVLRQSKSDRKLVNMHERLVDIDYEVRRVTDLLHDMNQKVAGKPTVPETTEPQEPDGIPDELMAMVLEILLLTRANSTRQDIRMAQGSVEYAGLPVWEGKKRT
ncbi:hypothetical protein SRCM100623_00626 [Acetobacter pasteurianus]|uniref:Uncharacterized protein n=1 Tax=Acetobacter pasteurianus TaxID=438 RepID=A0A1A0DII0_ACEPA|nr:hypothetical protein [Acetobacter pasteurianus]OAZ74492.1 hypothetical protein SRCM100623_00626 [Acetobacter pasteurianus]